MRILYVLPALQHPTIQRGGLRHYHFLRALARRHAVTLLALDRAQTTAEARAEVGALVQRSLYFPVDEAPPARGRLGVLGKIARELRLRATVRTMRRTFRAIASREPFDVVLFHGKVVYPVIRGFRGLPTVVDFCDATSMRLREQLRFATWLQAPWRLVRYLAAQRLERSLLAQTPHVAFISDRDRAAVLGAHSAAAVIPNGIDLAYWTRGAGAARPNRLVFTGVMSYAPNEDAARYLIDQILPVLRASRPDVELTIAGRDPTPAVLEAARRAPGVTVTGGVPDIRPYLEDACVYVAPIRFASGLQNKILEALAMGVPVVTTPAVAQGLRSDRCPEPPVRTADGVDGFAASVVALLDDAAERRRLAAAGRRFVEAEFDWVREAERLEALCRDAIAEAARPGLAPQATRPAGRRAPDRDLVTSGPAVARAVRARS